MCSEVHANFAFGLLGLAGFGSRWGLDRILVATEGAKHGIQVR
jgi:hypothetical protein